MNMMTNLAPGAIPANGPDLWDMILEQMPPGAVIAGGAVRDYLLGVQPKDIDVFMGQYQPPEPPPVEVGTPFVLTQVDVWPDPRCGLGRIDSIYERQEEYSAMTNIQLVSSGELYGHKVDAIEMTDFLDGFNLVRGFDFGLTRCWYDGEIHTTPQSRRDHQNKTVTLLLDDRRERALRRFARFNERMGGEWRLVEP